MGFNSFNFAVMGIGFILMGFGVRNVFLRKKKQRELFEIKATQTSMIKDLIDTCKSVNEELGTSGGFKQQVDVQGIVKCDKPLYGDLSKLACVFFETTVTEHGRGSDGKHYSSIVSHNLQRVNFYLQDETGTIVVNPDDAEIDAEQVVSDFKKQPNRDSKVDGHQYTEKIIPLDGHVYVLGEATESSGQLTIQASSEKGKPFIISIKSEQELIKAMTDSIQNLMVGAIALLIAGAGIFIFGFTHTHV